MLIISVGMKGLKTYQNVSIGMPEIMFFLYCHVFLMWYSRILIQFIKILEFTYLFIRNYFCLITFTNSLLEMKVS